MSPAVKFVCSVMAGLCLPIASFADTNSANAANTSPQTAPHRAHKAVKKPLPPPLPSGTRGPVPQIPLDAMPAVAPEIDFKNGLLTIVAPNSTLGDILRAVRKQTSADIDVPANANERVATHLGPAPPREVVAQLLNGSHFNYVLLGSPENVNALVRVVLVAKTGPDNPEPGTQANATPPPGTAKPAEEGDPQPEETFDEAADQAATEADQAPSTEEPGVKTPQEMLQEMQQRQLQLQQQQNGANNNTNGQQASPMPNFPSAGGVPMPPRGPGQTTPPEVPPQDQ
jgi:hypothetical protein